MSRVAKDDLRGVFLRHRWRLILSGVLMLVTMIAGVGLLGLSGGFLTATALAGALALGADFNFFSPSAGIRALTFVRIVSRYGEKLFGHDVTLRIARDLRVWFFRRALPLAPGRLSGTRIGDLLARLMTDIGEVDGLTVRALAPLFALLGIGVACIVVAVFVYWPAAVLLALMGIAIGVLVPMQVAVGADRRESLRAEQRTQLRTLGFEGLEGAADLAAVDASEAWLGKVVDAAGRVAEGDRIQRNRLVAGVALHSVCGALGMVGMLWLVLSATQRNVVDPAMAATLFFMTLALLEVWAGAGLAWQSLLAGRVAVSRLEAIIEQSPETVDPASPIAPPESGAVVFEDVHFSWGDSSRPVLDGIDLQIAPGERIAIGGDSGGGKTTLSSLLLRLRDPQRGHVRFGGVDLRDMAQDRWHARIAWLPQNAPVFAGSVRENLLLGRPGADDETLWHALGQVRLKDWAVAQQGLDTWVGENGATMSGGQARRLALARTLLREAPLMILDEPTEGLDVDTADALLRDLAQALGGRSLLMISHDTLPQGVVHRRYRMQDGRLSELH